MAEISDDDLLLSEDDDLLLSSDQKPAASIDVGSLSDDDLLLSEEAIPIPTEAPTMAAPISRAGKAIQKVSMRARAPGEFQNLERQPTPSEFAVNAAFSEALNSIASPGGTGFPAKLPTDLPGLAGGSPSVTEAINKAARDMSIQIAPPVADYIAGLPAIGAEDITLEKEDGSKKIIKAPKTIGEEVAMFHEAFSKEDPLVKSFKDRAKAYLKIPPGDFDSPIGSQTFIQEMKSMLGEGASHLVDYVPESIYGAASVGIDMFGLFQAGAGFRALKAASAAGMSAPAQAEMAEALALAGKTSRAAAVSSAEEASAGAGGAARRALSDVKAFFNRYGRAPTADDAQELLALRQPNLPINVVSEAEAAIDPPLRAMKSVKKGAKNLPSKGVLSEHYESIPMPGGLFGTKAEGPTLIDVVDKLAAQKAAPGVLAKTTGRSKLLPVDPEILIPRAGPAGLEIVDRIQSFERESALAKGKFFNALAGLKENKSLTSSDWANIRLLFDPVRREKFIGQSLDPDRSALLAMRRLLPTLDPAAQQRVVSAYNQIKAAMRIPVEMAEKAVTSDSEGFLLGDGVTFNDIAFNPNNAFSYYFDTVSDAGKEKILLHFRKDLLRDPNHLIKSTTMSADEFDELTSIKAQRAAEAAIRGYKDGRISRPENGWDLARDGLTGESKDVLGAIKKLGSDWIDRAVRIETIGPRASKLERLAQKIRANPPKGFNVGILNDTVKLAADGGLGAPGGFSESAIAYNVLTKLLAAPLSNLTQFSNAVAKFGIRDTASAFVDLLRADGKDAVVNFYKSVIQATEKQAIAEMVGTDVAGLNRKILLKRTLSPQQALDAIYFPLTERVQKLLAMKGSDYYVDRQIKILASKASLQEKSVAVARLKEAGIPKSVALNAAKTGKLSADDRARAAISLSDQIMSRASLTNVPLAFQDPVLKLLLQFKKQMYRQTVFLKNNLLGPSAGSIPERAAFLSKLLGVATAAGIPISVAKDFLAGKPVDEFAAVKLKKSAAEISPSMTVRDVASAVSAKSPQDVKAALVPIGELMRSLLETTGTAFSLGVWGELAQTITQEKRGIPGRGLLGPSGSELLDIGFAASRAAGKDKDIAPAGRLAISRGLPLLGAASGSPQAYLAAAALARLTAKTAFPVKGQKTPVTVGIEKIKELQQSRAMDRELKKIKLEKGKIFGDER